MKVTRRHFLRDGGVGLGKVARAGLLSNALSSRSSAAVDPLTPKAPPLPAKAKRVMPTVYSGVRFRNQRDPILDVSSPAGVDAALQRDTLDLVAGFNRRRLQNDGDPEIATRFANHEMAFKLQTSASARPTSSASTSPRTPSTSTTCRRPSCISSVSITRSSPTVSRGAISG